MPQYNFKWNKLSWVTLVTSEYTCLLEVCHSNAEDWTLTLKFVRFIDSMCTPNILQFELWLLIFTRLPTIYFKMVATFRWCAKCLHGFVFLYLWFHENAITLAAQRIKFTSFSIQTLIENVIEHDTSMWNVGFEHETLNDGTDRIYAISSTIFVEAIFFSFSLSLSVYHKISSHHSHYKVVAVVFLAKWLPFHSVCFSLILEFSFAISTHSVSIHLYPVYAIAPLFLSVSMNTNGANTRTIKSTF